jgi:hypothetical protein
MDHGPIQTFNEFRDIVHRYRSSAWVFRGVSNAEYELIPKIGRPPLSGQREQAIFKAFTRGAVAFTQLPASRMERLALAQHFGLPTRLLDWSENPLVAAYFACGGDLNADGAVYVLRAERLIDESKDAVDPFSVTEVARYYPSHVTPRITVQRGLFTVHPNPVLALDASSNDGSFKLHRILIPSAFKRKLRYDLSRFHVHRVSLFPDLEGLAGHIAWTYSNHDPYNDERSD